MTLTPVRGLLVGPERLRTIWGRAFQKEANVRSVSRLIPLAGAILIMLLTASPLAAQVGSSPPAPPPPPTVGPVPPAPPGPVVVVTPSPTPAVTTSPAPEVSPTEAVPPETEPSPEDTVEPRVIRRDTAGGPTVLPFTGAQLSLFVLVGVASTVVGTTLARMGRKRRASKDR